MKTLTRFYVHVLLFLCSPWPFSTKFWSKTWISSYKKWLINFLLLTFHHGISGTQWCPIADKEWCENWGKKNKNIRFLFHVVGIHSFEIILQMSPDICFPPLISPPQKKKKSKWNNSIIFDPQPLAQRRKKLATSDLVHNSKTVGLQFCSVFLDRWGWCWGGIWELPNLYVQNNNGDVLGAHQPLKTDLQKNRRTSHH